MVVTISNNKITTMIEGVAEGVVQEEVVGAMDPVGAEVMKISKNHHQVCITIYGKTTFSVNCTNVYEGCS